MALVERILEIVRGRPELTGKLRNMTVWEQADLELPALRADPNDYTERVSTLKNGGGWEWTEVATRPQLLNFLVDREVIRVVSSSRSHTSYCLVSLTDTIMALEKLDDVETVATAQIKPDTGSMFSAVVGQTKAKSLMRYALSTERPVHVLLQGPPGTAKTLMLQEVGQLPGAHFYVGGNITRAGLVQFLIQNSPRYLILDELDKMTPGDMNPLLSLMASGLVTRMVYGRQDRVEMQTWVFAGANDLDILPDAIKSRFQVVRINPYTKEQFITVASAVLEREEGLGPNLATLVATEVANYSTDIRDAVRVGRMVLANPNDVLDIIAVSFAESGVGQRVGRSRQRSRA